MEFIIKIIVMVLPFGWLERNLNFFLKRAFSFILVILLLIIIVIISIILIIELILIIFIILLKIILNFIFRSPFIIKYIININLLLIKFINPSFLEYLQSLLRILNLHRHSIHLLIVNLSIRILILPFDFQGNFVKIGLDSLRSPYRITIKIINIIIIVK
jgi:hypothetical protein